MGGTRRIIDEGQASAPAKSILSHEMKYVVCMLGLLDMTPPTLTSRIILQYGFCIRDFLFTSIHSFTINRPCTIHCTKNIQYCRDTTKQSFGRQQARALVTSVQSLTPQGF